MLRPSTAPRMNRHTSTGWAEPGAGGNGRASTYAARSRNRGSSPRLTSASPPDFTNTLLDTVIVPPLSMLLSLELGPAESQAYDQRPRRVGIADVGELVAQHVARVHGEDAAEEPCVHGTDERVGVRRMRDESLQGDAHTGEPARRQRDGSVHAVQQGARVDPLLLGFGVAGG